MPRFSRDHSPHFLSRSAVFIAFTLAVCPALAQSAPCENGAYVQLADGAFARVQQLTDDGQCMVQRFDRIMSFENPATLIPSDKDSYRAARSAFREAEEQAAAATQNVAGSAPSVCTSGLAVALADGTNGMIDETAATGMCKVTLASGEVTVLILEQMTVIEGGVVVTPPPTGMAGLVEGEWPCTAPGGETMHLRVDPGNAYALSDGSSGAFVAYDQLTVNFTSGPLAGVFGTVDNQVLTFTPPGAAERMTCKPQ